MSNSEKEVLLKQIEELKLAIAETNKKLAETERDERLARVQASSIWQYFQECKSLPALYKYGTKSGPSINVLKNHLPIKSTKLMEFGLLNLESIEHCKYRTTNIFNKKVLEYCSESEIYSFIGTIISDISFAAGLEDTLWLKCDLAILDLKADFWIMMINGFPVSAIEIMTPDKINKSKKDIIYGQLYDYLLRLRSLHGLSNVIGIYTNFNEWEICWLPDSDSCALATDLTYGEVLTNPLIACERVLHKSKTFSRSSSKELGIALYSVLKKISYNASFLTPVQLVSPSRSYILADETAWYWESGLKGIDELILTMPSKGSKLFYFLHDFRGGRDGRVWLACDPSGKLAVIKFLKANKDATVAEDEVRNWHALGHSSVFMIKLINRFAVVLPFAFFYKDDKDIDESWWSHDQEYISQIKDFENILKEAKEIDPKTVALACVQGCSNACLIHNDIEWRHVALFPTTLSSDDCSTQSSSSSLLSFTCSFKYSFIDLTDMTATKSSKEAYDVMKVFQDSLLNPEL